MGDRHSKSRKPTRGRTTSYAGAGAFRALPPLPSSPSNRTGRACEVCLVALALGLLALVAGAQFVPVLLLVALALGAWRPRR
jgi:hypothetical protein